MGKVSDSILRFIQIHMLMCLPPSLPNRDDQGHAKSVRVAGVKRQRISSQCNKHSWRNSSHFLEDLQGHTGQRSKRFVTETVHEKLTASGADEEVIESWMQDLMAVYGKPDAKANEKPNESPRYDVSTLVFLSHHEIEQLHTFAAALSEHLIGRYDGPLQALLQDLDGLRAEREHHVAGKKSKKDKTQAHARYTKYIVERLVQALLSLDNLSVDISLFGRMMAGTPTYNVEAACQVSHAFTVHASETEDDYFSAVDDLNAGLEHSGSGHLGRTEFGSGIYYVYVCVDRELLLRNLQGDEELTRRALRSLLNAMATVTPTGKQNSFATRALASWIMVEKGSSTPFSLSSAYLDPVKGPNMLEKAITRVESLSEDFAAVYDNPQTARQTINVAARQGSFHELLSFIAEPPKGA